MTIKERAKSDSVDRSHQKQNLSKHDVKCSNKSEVTSRNRETTVVD